MPGKRRLRAVVTRNERYQQFIDGTLKASDLTTIELQKGYCTYPDGTFRGRPPQMIPRALAKAMVSELQERMAIRFREEAMNAIDVMVGVMNDGEGAQTTEYDDRGKPTVQTREGTKKFEAARYLIERVMGPIPQKLQVDSEVSIWQQSTESGDLIIDVEEISDSPEGKAR